MDNTVPRTALATPGLSINPPEEKNRSFKRKYIINLEFIRLLFGHETSYGHTGSN